MSAVKSNSGWLSGQMTPLYGQLAGIGLLIVLTLFFVGSLNPYYLRVLTIGLLYGYLASSWNIIGGYAGQMSLGNAIFFGIGSYGIALSAQHGVHPLVMALPLALVVSAFLAWVVATICFRYALKGIYFAVGTLLLAEIVRMTVINSTFLGRSQGIQFTPPAGYLNMQFESDLPYFYIMAALAAVMILGIRKLERSKFGFSLVALREDEDGAKALGVDTNNLKRAAFVLSAMLAAVGGFVYAGLIRFVEPGYDLSVSITLIMIMGAVVGGRGTAIGPFVGGFVVVVIQELLTSLGSAVGTTAFSALAQMTYGLFFVVVLLIFPRGLIGEWRRRQTDRRARVLAAEELPGDDALPQGKGSNA